MQEYTHTFTIYFLSKLPLIYSAVYIYIKAINQKCSKSKVALYLTAFFGISLISALLNILNNGISILANYILFITLITLLTKTNIKLSIPISIVSLGLAYYIRFITLTIIAPISYWLSFTQFDFMDVDSIYLNLIVSILNLIITYLVMKIKRLKNGLAFFNNTNNFGLGLLLSGFAFISVIIISDNNDTDKTLFFFLFIGLIICCIGTVIWVRSSITRHYKSKLQQKADEHFNTIIAEKESEIAELTDSNTFLSKIVHRDNHLMTSLQYSLAQLQNCSDKNEQNKIILELLTLAKERNELVQKEQKENKVLVSTGNSVIDGALLNMYIKAAAHKINFDLIVSADINYIINHFITQTELETLLCDHIKDSIIAVESANIANGIILTSVSMADGIYEISVNDNGVEFEPTTLDKLGIERVTTHKESGGNGIGFMTSFETLKKANASIIITEYEPDKPFRKTITFKFDGKNEFNIKTYRYELLKEKLHRTDVKITTNQ